MELEKVDKIEALKKLFTTIENAFGDGDDDMFVVDLNDAVREEKVINVDIPKID